MRARKIDSNQNLIVKTNDITKNALIELKLRGYEVWRQNQVKVRGRKFIGKLGLSDIQGYCKSTGRAVYCEVKGPGDSLSDDQRAFLNGAKKSGAIVLLAESDRNSYKIIGYENNPGRTSG